MYGNRDNLRVRCKLNRFSRKTRPRDKSELGATRAELHAC